MRKSFTATTTPQSIQATEFAVGLLPQTIQIQNKGANPLFFSFDEVAGTTGFPTIAAGLSNTLVLTQPLTYMSFITTGGDSEVVIFTC